MYQLQNIDYLYRISTMTGLSKLVTIQADRNLHDLNNKKDKSASFPVVVHREVLPSKS